MTIQHSELTWQIPNEALEIPWSPSDRPRLYRVHITTYPAGSWAQYGFPDGTDCTPTLRTSWKPEGWESDPRSTDRDGNTADFWWPSTSRTYASRSAAQERAALIESYGATALVLETEAHWVPLDEAAASRKTERDQARIQKLEAKIEQIKQA
ncbi:hypothetical protein ART_0195 [Arthrobacter sp. PAMC 25486]|uniref:hypothetical protein n=1 Tax=Arthrobacter sp. PAMC 25486 TaxID=1494608 RepID=UPI000535AF3E|nr:hypothetical protein [Arthrobacter sp. PAMC 25486]AIX99793.1 hypothetical protein ART_0195 [Arthrobacter sp. PAMC 25486]